MERLRDERRWTLSGLMLLIAMLAVPLALYARRAREAAALEQAELENLARMLANDKGIPESRFPTIHPSLRYFEYGSDDEETPK